MTNDENAISINDSNTKPIGEEGQDISGEYEKELLRDKRGPSRIAPCDIKITLKLDSVVLNNASALDHQLHLCVDIKVDRNKQDMYSKELTYTATNMSILVAGVGENFDDPDKRNLVESLYNSQIESSFQKYVSNFFTKHVCITAPSRIYSFFTTTDNDLELNRLKKAYISKLFSAPITDLIPEEMKNSDTNNESKSYVNDETKMNVLVVLDVAFEANTKIDKSLLTSSSMTLENENLGNFVCVCEIVAVRTISDMTGPFLSETRAKANKYLEQFEKVGGLESEKYASSERLLQYTMTDMYDFFLKPDMMYNAIKDKTEIANDNTKQPKKNTKTNK